MQVRLESPSPNNTTKNWSIHYNNPKMSRDMTASYNPLLTSNKHSYFQNTDVRRCWNSLSRKGGQPNNLCYSNPSSASHNIVEWASEGVDEVKEWAKIWWGFDSKKDSFINFFNIDSKASRRSRLFIPMQLRKYCNILKT